MRIFRYGWDKELLIKRAPTMADPTSLLPIGKAAPGIAAGSHSEDGWQTALVVTTSYHTFEEGQQSVAGTPAVSS